MCNQSVLIAGEEGRCCSFSVLVTLRCNLFFQGGVGRELVLPCCSFLPSRSFNSSTVCLWGSAVSSDPRMPAPRSDSNEGLVLCTGAVLCLGLLSASCCYRASKAANISHFVALGARHFQRSNVLPVLWAGAEEQTRALGPTIVSSA